MMDTPPTMDLETREFLAQLKDGQNPAIVAFIDAQEGQTQALHEPLRTLGITILGSVDRVTIVRAPARSLPRAAALNGVRGVEGWPSADRQEGSHPLDVQRLKTSAPTDQRRIAVLVRLRGEPDPAARETMDLVGLHLFPGQSDPVRAGTLPVNAIEDALAIPAIVALKISQASLAARRATIPQVPPGTPNEGKLSATTRMLLDETPPQSNPQVAVFVEFASTPSAEEQARMDGLGLELTPGGGLIKTGRIPLRNIRPLSALDCVAALEASTPLRLDTPNETPSQNSNETEP